METNKLVAILKKNDIRVSSFSEPDDLVDCEINLVIPKKDIHIQIALYEPEHGLILNETIGAGTHMRIKTLQTFRLSKGGILKMMFFIKKLAEN
jgi:hypothetical protein